MLDKAVPITIYKRHNAEVETHTCTISKSEPLIATLNNSPDDQELIIRWIQKGDYDTSRYEELPHLSPGFDTRNIILFDNETNEYVVINGGRHRVRGLTDQNKIISKPVSNT